VRFDRIHLENFKCYEETDLRLDRGVTVIHGLNGSGKSSLLEACFFALYGAKALDRTLDEVVTIGAEECVVELEFTHDGADYRVRRRIRVSNGDARTAECVLEGPGGTTEGATDVRERVTGLLRMDAEAFVNCAYVRQGEVNKLINASPGERQDMIDDLLQLGKLEEYRERASDARVGVGRVRDDKQGALSEVEEQIDAKEAKNLHATRNELATERSEVDAEIERFEENRREAERTRDQAQEIIDEYEQKQADLADLDEQITALRERIQGTERERDQLADEIEAARERRTDARDRRDERCGALDRIETDPDAVTAAAVEEQIDTVQSDIDDLTEQIREKSVEKQEQDSTAETLREQADELESEAAEKRAEADDLEAEVADARDLLDRKREDLSEMGKKIEAHREAFAGAPIDVGEADDHRESVAEELAALREQRAQTEAALESAREQLAEAEQLLEAGKCPECGQPVEDSPHVDAIDERRERVTELEAKLDELDDSEDDLQKKLERAEALAEHESETDRLEHERENQQQLLDERESNVEEKSERVEQLREAADEAESDAEEKREQAEDALERAEACQEEIAAFNREKSELAEQREQLDDLVDAIETVAEADEKLDRLRERRAEKADQNDERRERLAELRERRDDLREEFDAERVETAREQKQEAVAYLDQVGEKLDDLADRRSTLQERIGAIENEIEELEALRERRDDLEETVEHLESLYRETADLEEMYGQLRAELRRQNVESLERMLNETFDLVYENDTYARIELDGEYRLTVYQKDGSELDPQQLSGGERALFNLSLRCAIYRLLAQGIEGAAPMPPLILDEPTVFLDSGHVSQLVELVESMRKLGVEQILVVSHDEELVGAADDLVRVRKDSTTNRSTVQRGRMDEQVLEAADD
jgi:exonuclease SbcC